MRNEKTNNEHVEQILGIISKGIANILLESPLSQY
jgi:hypothetical protein